MATVTSSPGGSGSRSFDIGTSLDRALNTYYEKGTTWIPWVDADGVATRTLVTPLARNALVRAFTVRVGAARADFTALANAGQVRLQAESGGSKIIVVDFGMLRTVSGIGRVGGDGAPSLTICSLRAFRGDAFDTVDLYLEDCAAIGIDDMMVRSIEQNTFETRTDRVRITVKTTAALPAIADALWLQFPDLPTDLDLRVNGGTPPWQAPGVAQPNVRGWNADTEQDVDLTAALAALTGDAADSSPLDATIVLSSRIPGKLSLVTLVEDIAYLGRLTFAGSEQLTVTLPQEGEYDVALQLPTWVKKVEELRLVVTATVPPERIIEPVGPPIALQAGGSGAAYDLLLDVDHAGSARLDEASRLSELTAVRLPLRAGADGAEVRVVVHEGNAQGPLRPTDGGTTTPVDLPPAATDDGDVWTTFALPKSLKLNPVAHLLGGRRGGAREHAVEPRALPRRGERRPDPPRHRHGSLVCAAERWSRRRYARRSRAHRRQGAVHRPHRPHQRRRGRVDRARRRDAHPQGRRGDLAPPRRDRRDGASVDHPHRHRRRSRAHVAPDESHGGERHAQRGRRGGEQVTVILLRIPSRGSHG